MSALADHQFPAFHSRPRIPREAIASALPAAGWRTDGLQPPPFRNFCRLNPTSTSTSARHIVVRVISAVMVPLARSRRCRRFANRPERPASQVSGYLRGCRKRKRRTPLRASLEALRRPRPKPASVFRMASGAFRRVAAALSGHTPPSRNRRAARRPRRPGRAF